MSDKVLLALIALGSAIIGSLVTPLVAPWVKYAIEKRNPRTR